MPNAKSRANRKAAPCRACAGRRAAEREAGRLVAEVDRLHQTVRDLEAALWGERVKRRWAEREADGLARDKGVLEGQRADLLGRVAALAAEARKLRRRVPFRPVYPVADQGDLFGEVGDPA